MIRKHMGQEPNMADKDRREANSSSDILDKVLADYLRSAEVGKPLDESELLQKYPEIAADLRSFFENRRLLEIAAEPFRGNNNDLFRRAGPNRIQYLGDYELLEEIGVGGMGVIFKARQTSLRRIVAVKMVLGDRLSTFEDRQRFRIEAEAAASLEHPNILPIYEVGEYEGRQYFSMKLVEGGNWSQRFADGPQAVRESARLMVKVANAVQFAHAHGILHRDLKPANILVNHKGEPFVTDFGLAKRIKNESDLTQTGAVLGTPSYMAPEQAGGRNRSVTTATDVYGLGAILYAALTGRAPFQAENVIQTLKDVLEREPIRPSNINRQVDRDLETVCLKCLEKEPSRRYPSAEALARDLTCYLAGEPVTARSIGFLARSWRWCRRNSIVAGLMFTVALCLLIGTTVSSFYALEANKRANAEAFERGRADDKTGEALREKADAVIARGEAEKNAALAERRTKEAIDSARLARCSLYVAHANLEQTAWEDTRIGSVLELLERDRPRDGEEDLRGFEWYYWNRLCHREAQTLHGHVGSVNGVAFSPDGTLIASAGSDTVPAADGNTIKIWDAATGEEIRTLRGHTRNVVCIAFSPDGSRIASGGIEGEVKVWDAATGQIVHTCDRKAGSVTGVAYSSDGTLIGSASLPNTVTLYDSATSRSVQTFSATSGSVDGVALSSDGKWIASGGKAKVTVWEVSSGKEVYSLAGHTNEIHSVAFSPDATQLASASRDRTVKLWNMTSGDEIQTFQAHKSPVHCVAFSPDGIRIASASGDGLVPRNPDNAVRLWNVETGEIIDTLKGHSGAVAGVAFSPDGSKMASVGGGTVKLWNVGLTEETPTLQIIELYKEPMKPTQFPSPVPGTFRVFRKQYFYLSPVAYGWNGAQIAVGYRNGNVKLFNPASGNEVRTFQGHNASIVSVVITNDGLRIASVDKLQVIKVWDVATGNELHTLTPNHGAVSHIVFSPAGHQFALGGADGSVTIWDSATGKELRRYKLHSASVSAIAFHPDGICVGSASMDGNVRLWSRLTGKNLVTLKGDATKPVTIAFSPNGRHFAAGSTDAIIHLWDAATGDERPNLKGHSSRITRIAFSPDSNRIASGSYDHSIKLWDVATSQETLTLKGHLDGVFEVAFNSDGTQLASASRDGTVKLWQAPQGDAITEVRRKRTHEPVTTTLPVSNSRPVETIDSAAKKWNGIFVGEGFKATWSPDGKSVVYGTFPAGTGLKRYEIESKTTSELRSAGKDPSFAPGMSKRIAFTSGNGKDEQIWVLNGDEAKMVTKGGFASWLPDGKSIIWLTQPDKSLLSLDIMAEASNAKSHGNLPPGASWYPFFSYDGRYAAYAEGPAIIVLSLDDGATKKFAFPNARVPKGFIGSWHPLEQRLAFGSYGHGENYGTWVLDLVSGEFRQLFSGDTTMPVWSPDGKRLAIDLREGTHPYQLRVFDAPAWDELRALKDMK
jgi:WD40 repeat protein/tRNA A-37 threonylcarbamoyl transferase component Bud32